MLTEIAIAAVAEAIIGYALDQGGAGAWLRDQLRGDPVKRALQDALDSAMADVEAGYPAIVASLFDASFLQKEGASILAQILWRHGHPTDENLARAWSDSIGLDGDTRASQIAVVLPAANLFLTRFEENAKKETALSEIFDRRNREQTTDNTTAIAADTARLVQVLEQSVLRASGNPEDYPQIEPCPQYRLVLGRDSDIQKVGEQVISLTGPHALVLYGFQGVGKTAVATKVYQNLTTHFDRAVWYSADDPFRLAGLFARVTGTELTKGIAEQGAAQMAQRLLDALANAKVLMVLDGFEKLVGHDQTRRDRYNSDFVTFVQYLYEADIRESRVLLTGWRDLETNKHLAFPSMRMKGLSEDNSILLLRTLLSAGSQPAVETSLSEIAQRGFGNPQALHWLAGYANSLVAMSGGKTTITDFLEYAQKHLWSEAEIAENVFRFGQNSASFLTRDEQIILRDLVAFDRAVPADAVVHMRREAKGWTPAKVTPLLIQLERKAMVSSFESSFGADDVVTAYYSSATNRDLARHRRAADWYRTQKTVEDPKDWSSVGDCEAYLHIVGHLLKAREYEEAFELWWNTSMAFHLTRLGLHIERIRLGSDFLDAIEEKHWDVEPWQQAWLLRNVGYSHEIQGDQAKAVESLTNAIDLLDAYEDQTGDLAVMIAMNKIICLNSLAACHRDHKRFREAMACHEQAILIFETEPYSDTRSMARTYGDMGHTLLAQGLSDKDENSVMRAIDLFEKARDMPDHLAGDRSRSISFLAEASAALGECDIALRHGKAAVALAKEEGEVFARTRALRAMSQCTYKHNPKMSLALLMKSDRLLSEYPSETEVRSNTQLRELLEQELAPIFEYQWQELSQYDDGEIDRFVGDFLEIAGQT